MQIKITVDLDDQQIIVRGQSIVDEIATALEFTAAGAMHQFKDGNTRHGHVLDYEIKTELHY